MTEPTDETTPTWVIHRQAVPNQSDPFVLPIVDDADIIQVGPQESASTWDVHLWARYRTDIPRPQVVAARWFRVIGDGEEHQGDWRGTFVRGVFVLHVIEVEAPPASDDDSGQETGS